mmetsp:Transcript_13468/g.45530  ORF Transcript_13468/g.45530 Transcript_13468/m.45530 type:complete len:243 (+) Transcript_13468:158-886(+)
MAAVLLARGFPAAPGPAAATCGSCPGAAVGAAAGAAARGAPSRPSEGTCRAPASPPASSPRGGPSSPASSPSSSSRRSSFGGKSPTAQLAPRTKAPWRGLHEKSCSPRMLPSPPPRGSSSSTPTQPPGASASDSPTQRTTPRRAPGCTSQRIPASQCSTVSGPGTSPDAGAPPGPPRGRMRKCGSLARCSRIHDRSVPWRCSYCSSVSSNFLTRFTFSRPPLREREWGSVSTTCISMPDSAL